MLELKKTIRAITRLKGNNFL